MSAVGRFAPSPSGPLHFGSLVAALASYCEARARGGRWLLRIEDVDTPRVVAGAAERILRDLEACGLAWDGAVSYQSERFDLYQAALDELIAAGHVYACECSRRGLREQGAARGPLGRIYPGNCRDKRLALAGHSLRVDTRAAGEIGFIDRVYGCTRLTLPREVGDFVLRRVDGVYAYHLAVVVDDEQQGVDHIVRGADLLHNTCLHLYLQRLLGYRGAEYLHLPLVNNAEGVKLSKQTGAGALNLKRASSLLIAALRHLGQDVSGDMEGAGVDEIVAAAVANWRVDSIPRVPLNE